MAVYLAIDPSFSGTGLAALDTDERRLFLHTVRVPPGWKKDFTGVYHSAQQVFVGVEDFIQSLPNPRIDFLISEFPPPFGQMAAALYGLDNLLISKIQDRFQDPIQSAYVVGASYLGHLMQRNGKTPADLRMFGESLITVYGNFFGLPTDLKKTRKVVERVAHKITADESVALAFLSRLVVREDPSSRLSVSLTSLCPNLSGEHEFLLFGDDDGKSESSSIE